MAWNQPPTNPPASAIVLLLGLMTCGQDVSLSELSASDSGDSGEGMTDPTESSPPAAPTLQLDFAPIKQFEFTWAAADGAAYYRLLERVVADGEYAQLGDDIFSTAVAHTMPLHLRFGASYVLQACNNAGCTDSATVDVVDSMASAVGYVKPSTVGPNHYFGTRIALSDDGRTLAVSVPGDSSAATGIDGGQADNSAPYAGAVYVFVRTNAAWSQQAYLKASNTDAGDGFGGRLALSPDGSTLAVSATGESSAATGVDGDQLDNSAKSAGAVYLFVRDGAVWSQQAYIKAANSQAGDNFGLNVALSADGDTLAVGAIQEDSAATGVGGDQTDNDAENAGAVYLFERVDGAWSQQAYLKAANTDPGDNFGQGLALSADGDTLVVGAVYEQSSVGGDPSDDTAEYAGAAYVFIRANGAWTQQAYLKPAHPGPSQYFGENLALSADGDTLAVGAVGESSAATGIDGDQSDVTAPLAGAAFVFVRVNGAWSQQAYIKASNTAPDDLFGLGVALSADGSTLAVIAHHEDSAAAGVGGDQTDDSLLDAGAVYVFTRVGDAWSQRAYVKTANPGPNDLLYSVALSADGTTLAVGATGEDSAATGIGGDPLDDSLENAGAVYLF